MPANFERKLISLPFWICVISVILHTTYSTDCNTASSCSDKHLTCSGSSCPLNCNADDSCAGSTLICTDDYLHGTCIINCMGEYSCGDAHIISYRDITILCDGYDSCDDLTVEVYGDNPNDKISATLTSQGSYTDTVLMECHNDGISSCDINCVDNGDYYTCIGVSLDCYTIGTCTHHCDSSDACCGCSLSCGFLCSTDYINELNCYEGTGNNNCIQEDPGGCSESYGCIAMFTHPTPLPTPSPTPLPTKHPIQPPSPSPTPSPTSFPSPAPTSIPSAPPTPAPTSIPSDSPTGFTISPTKSPTFIPSTSPTRHPTEPFETPDPSKTPTKNPTPAPTDNPTKDPTNDPTSDPTFDPTTDPTSDPTFDPTIDPTFDPTFEPTLEPTWNPTLEPTLSPTNAPSTPPTAAPSRDPDAPTWCISMIERIEHLIGIKTSDFENDNKLLLFTMNSTKLVIYDAIRGSNIYNMNALCENFWKCFFLKVTSIDGDSDTRIDFEVCAWDKKVHDALLHKIVDDDAEMEAYMVQLFEWYLNGPKYNGYNGVRFTNLTKVWFDLATTTTPGPTNGELGSTTRDTSVTNTDIDPSRDEDLNGVDSFLDTYFNYLLYGGVGLLLLCLCIFFIIFVCCRKQNNMKRELEATKLHIERLKSLSTTDAAHHLSDGGVNDMGEGIDSVAPDVDGNINGHTIPMGTRAVLNTNDNDNDNDNVVPASPPQHPVSDGQSQWTQSTASMQANNNGYQVFNTPTSQGMAMNNMNNMNMGVMGMSMGMVAMSNPIMNPMRYGMMQNNNNMNYMPNQMPNSMPNMMSLPLPPPPMPDNNNLTPGDNAQIVGDASKLILHAEDLPESDKDEDDEDDEYEYYEEEEEDENEYGSLYNKVNSGTDGATLGTPNDLPVLPTLPVLPALPGLPVPPPLNDELEYGNDELERVNVLNNEYYSYEEIINSDVLKGVENKEEYLNDQEFEQVFNMDKQTFNSLQPWKQKSLRVAKGLF